MRRFFLPLSLCLLLSACAPAELTMKSYDGASSVTLTVEVADSQVERTQGLMNRTALAPETGMFFAFPTATQLTFWMKNTKIPLEILFFDPEGSFVNALSMKPCTTEPCPTYKAAALSQYALEVNPGFRETHKIGVGWKLDMKTVKKIARAK